MIALARCYCYSPAFAVTYCNRARLTDCNTGLPNVLFGPDVVAYTGAYRPTGLRNEWRMIAAHMNEVLAGWQLQARGLISARSCCV